MCLTPPSTSAYEIEVYSLWYNSMKLLLVCMFEYCYMERMIQLIGLLLYIMQHYILQAVSDILHVPMYRTDITEIPMKECSAYGEVGYSYDCDQREEPHVYESPHAQ